MYFGHLNNNQTHMNETTDYHWVRDMYFGHLNNNQTHMNETTDYHWVRELQNEPHNIMQVQ